MANSAGAKSSGTAPQEPPLFPLLPLPWEIPSTPTQPPIQIPWQPLPPNWRIVPTPWIPSEPNPLIPGPVPPGSEIPPGSFTPPEIPPSSPPWLPQIPPGLWPKIKPWMPIPGPWPTPEPGPPPLYTPPGWPGMPNLPGYIPFPLPGGGQGHIGIQPRDPLNPCGPWDWGIGGEKRW